MTEKERKAKLRAEVILKVRSGQITATQGARMLGVSRKTYYEWEKRGLAQMMEALTEKPSGRKPQKVDPEKESLRAENEELKKQLSQLRTRDRIREVLEGDITNLSGSTFEKKDGSGKKR